MSRHIQYQCNCAGVGIEEWNKLMKGARPCSYKNLCRLIKRDVPDMYEGLMLDYYNPYADQCKQTKTHYILVSSMTEYFFKKI